MLEPRREILNYTRSGYLATRVSSCLKIVYILSEQCDVEHSLLFKYVFYL